MAREPFQYTVIRVVPRIEREEFVNVGVALYCRTMRFLGVRVTGDLGRVDALAPGTRLDALTAQLSDLVRVIEGDPGAGPLAALPASERFGWLAAPSSTMIQASGAHTGLCEDPSACLGELFERLVG